MPRLGLEVANGCIAPVVSKCKDRECAPSGVAARAEQLKENRKGRSTSEKNPVALVDLSGGMLAGRNFIWFVGRATVCEIVAHH